MSCSAFGLELPATAIFDYPTIDALAAMLAEQVSDASPAPAQPAAAADEADSEDSASESESGSGSTSDDDAGSEAPGSDHEQQHPNSRRAAPPELPPINKHAPLLKRPGYFTVRLRVWV